MIRSQRIAVAEAAALLTSPQEWQESSRVVIRNRGVGALFVGGADVSVGEGFELAAGGEIALPLPYGEQLFGISTATGTEVDVLQVGVAP